MKLFPFFNRPEIKVDTEKNHNTDRLKKTDNVSLRDAVVDPDRKKRNQYYNGGKGEEGRDEAKDHFESLKNSAELANNDLDKKKSPYRFYVFQENDEVFINLVRLNSEGAVVEVRKKNITHQEFAELIRHIEEGEGFFIDSIG